MVSNGNMPYYTHLAPDLTIFSDFCRSGNSRLGRYYGMFPYLYIMGYLYLIVEFYAPPENGRAQGRPIYGGAGAVLYVVLKDNVSCLWYFGVFPFIIGRKSKSIRDRKSTRLNSSHVKISYAVLFLK